MMFGSPVSLRSLAALRLNNTGAYVSGMKAITGIVATAMRVETANTHRHEVFSDMKPEITGAITGPEIN